MITIELPGALRPFAGGKSALVVDEPCATTRDALAAMGSRSPGALDRVMDETGEVRPHVNVFVNGESIRFLDGLGTPTPSGSTIVILAAVSGG